MPQADLLYSADLDLDPKAILTRVEQVIAEHDAGAGACKGRAYPAETFQHTHVTLQVSMLDKPHRTAAFMTALLGDIERAVKAQIAHPCALAVQLTFSGPYYSTALHEGRPA